MSLIGEQFCESCNGRLFCLDCDKVSEEQDRNEEFETLRDNNENLRKEINKLMGKNFSVRSKEYKEMWEKINILINNEIKQENLCEQ